MGYKVCLSVVFVVLALAGLVIARNDLIVGSLGSDSVLIYQ